jgi:hypothetical protein
MDPGSKYHYSREKLYITWVFVAVLTPFYRINKHGAVRPPAVWGAQIEVGRAWAKR